MILKACADEQEGHIDHKYSQAYHNLDKNNSSSVPEIITSNIKLVRNITISKRIEYSDNRSSPQCSSICRSIFWVHSDKIPGIHHLPKGSKPQKC